jgi:outer membrane protein OmpA-like peptidoglycan-associated protein
MKDCRFVALLLSTAIALPACAQQTNSSPSAQPATTTSTPSQSTTASPREPLRDTRSDFWDGDEPGAAALIFHPFASKGYVRRQTAPIRDRINELEEITAAQGNQIKDTDGGAQQGIQLVSKKTTEADQHALDASNKAQMAQQAASTVNTHLSKVEPVVQNIDQYKAGARTEIRFRSGQGVLSKDAKEALDQMATPLRDQHGYVIEVQGFSSGQGQAAIAASRKMADSVVRYLVLSHEIPAYRIYVVGMGNAPATGEDETTGKHSRGSWVRISVLKNSLDQLASAPASSGTSTPPK